MAVRIAVVALAGWAVVVSAASSATAVQRGLTVDGETRHYYLLIPEELGSEPAPLLLVLHGSGGDARGLLNAWGELAARERIVLAAPEAIDRTSWQVPEDGPEFLYRLVEEVKAGVSVDPRRVYLFGHSAGAWFGMKMALLESEYFAAAALSAGGLQPGGRPQLLAAARKIPLTIFIGVEDTVVPLATARETRDTLAAEGFPVHLIEIERHDHNYRRRAPEINRQAWEFLAAQALDAEPHYQAYRVPARR